MEKATRTHDQELLEIVVKQEESLRLEHFDAADV